MKRQIGLLNPDRYAVRVVDRGLDVLELLRDASRPLGLPEISHRLSSPKTSVFRLLCTLERRGYVERVDARGSLYKVGAVCRTYVEKPVDQGLFEEVATRHMRRLLDRFGETVSLAMPRGGNLIYIKMLESPHPFRMAAQVGSRLPIHSTALGKAVAAFLPGAEVEDFLKRQGLRPLTPRTITSLEDLKRELRRTRAKGYAEDNGETEPEASCIGAPVFGNEDRPMGAISISGPTSRIRAIRSRAARALLEECRTLSHFFGHRSSLPTTSK